MRPRTCAPADLLALIEARRHDGRIPVVGIAGFPGAYAETLAELVRQRLGEVVVWVGGPDLFATDPDLDVRVWMDVDLETAFMLGAMETFKASRRNAVPGQEPTGTWTADAGDREPQGDPAEGVSFDRHRPDLAADLLFAPVGGVRPPIELRFMSEDSCDFVLWDEENDWIGELEALLPVSDDLRRRIADWVRDESATDGSGSRSAALGARHRERGRRLAEELQSAIGPDFRVDYRG